MEDGGHTLQPHSLGTGDKCPPPQHTHKPQISELFDWDWEGAQKLFILRDQTTVASFTSPGHTHSPVCAPTATLSYSRVVMWVIRFHISMHYRIYLQYHIMREKGFLFISGHSRPLRSGGGGGGTLGPALIFINTFYARGPLDLLTNDRILI